MELDKTLPMVTKYADLENYKKKDIIAVGILSEEKFVNGGGKVFDFTELWLKMEGGEKIKLRPIGEHNTKALVGKKVMVQGNLFHGNIDSDDPKQQSRYGYRLDFTKIVGE